jgi:hypothetical protein
VEEKRGSAADKADVEVRTEKAQRVGEGVLEKQAQGAERRVRPAECTHEHQPRKVRLATGRNPEMKNGNGKWKGKHPKSLIKHHRTLWFCRAVYMDLN